MGGAPGMGAGGNSGSNAVGASDAPGNAGAAGMRMGTGVNGQVNTNGLGASGATGNIGSNATGNTNPCAQATASAGGGCNNNQKSP